MYLSLSLLILFYVLSTLLIASNALSTCAAMTVALLALVAVIATSAMFRDWRDSRRLRRPPFPTVR